MPFFGLFGPPDMEKLKAKGDVQGLIKALNYEKDVNVRQAADERLGQIRNRQAVRPLMAVFKDQDSGVQQAIEIKIVKVAGGNYGIRWV